MDDATGSAVRSVLERDLCTTQAMIESLTGDFDAIVEAADTVNNDDEHDPEGATIAFERAQVSSMLTRARTHLLDIDTALADLDAGTYGTCRTCAKPIAGERLDAQPTARTCVVCASGSRPSLGGRQSH